MTRIIIDVAKIQNYFEPMNRRAKFMNSFRNMKPNAMMSNPNDQGANLMHVDSHHVNFRSTSTGTGVGTGFSISRIRSAVVSVLFTGTSTGTSNFPGFVSSE